MFTNRVVETNGIRMAVLDRGEGPAVVLCHGFPELAYSWRHQVPALVAAGFHALVPDQRGYGATDRPGDVATYDIHHLTGDLVGLLDALEVERAVFVGHDWGGAVVWMMPLLHPARTAGVVGVNTPYLPRPPLPPVSLLKMMFGDDYYVVHFQQPGVADEGLGRQVRRVFTQLMRGGIPPEMLATLIAERGMRNMVQIVEGEEGPGEPVVTEDELRVYVETFERTGFTGGINWYRNIDHNWETTAHTDGMQITVPSLMVVAEWDPVLRPELTEPMKALVPDLEIATILRCGHWTQAERPDELNRILVDWLTRRFR
jgi:pimeloyl-ACP methyl ester carboxylesterase